MRLWSLHPSMLDSKGLIACWRESLLAQAVLTNKTKGYKNHSQLIRFKQTHDPVLYIGSYLYSLYEEGKNRGYNFDLSKIQLYGFVDKMIVTDSQMNYEFKHLQNKLILRDHFKYLENTCKQIIPNTLFNVVEGEIERWENIQ